MSVHKILETTLEVRGEMTPEYEAILTPEALVFVEELVQALRTQAQRAARDPPPAPGVLRSRRPARFPARDPVCP